jgi:murein DD-endopeptidase MepM/ murein hydrolase activator NlpD
VPKSTTTEAAKATSTTTAKATTTITPTTPSTTVALVDHATTTTTTAPAPAPVQAVDPGAPDPNVAPDPNELRPIVFPVLGATLYYDTFGAYRADIATHVHIGTDLMGVKLQPLVAAVDGTITHLVVDHPTAGWGLVITDDEGWDYRYYHMNNDTPGTDDNASPVEWRLAPGLKLGDRVVAGQLVGYMGNSGDAQLSAPHLHFEIHRPDQSAVNPFPSLRAAQHSTQCAPPVGFGQLPGFVPPVDGNDQVVVVHTLTGDGTFTLSPNGSVFPIGAARDIGSPRYTKADPACPAPAPAAVPGADG